ncbi:signal recognition particle protein, partial [Halobacteriovorax sp. HFRX-2_2]
MFDNLSDKFSEAFKNISGKGKITESNIEDTLKLVKTALLEADVNFKVVKNFINNVKEEALGEKVIKGVNPEEQFIKIVHDELAKTMGDKNTELNYVEGGITPILVVGLNGQGKTTFSGKLSLFLTKKEKKNVLLVPADTFRPAAKDQLITLAKSMNMDWFDSDLGKHPKDIAADAMAYAKEHGKEVVIIDTAGRLHVDEELMGQIKEVRQSLEGLNPEVLMVADAMTGQEAVNVAKSFHEAVGLTGVVLSKMDSDARGGAALSIKHVTGVPIKFISTGEKMKDLELFHPDRLAGRILDMGDVLTLVEKAEAAIDKDDAEGMMKRLEKGKFSVNDFMKQMDMMKNLGSMASIMKMIPGMGGMLKQVGDLTPAENEMKR